MSASPRPLLRLVALAVGVAALGACSSGATDDAAVPPTSGVPATSAQSTTTAATAPDVPECPSPALEAPDVVVADSSLAEISGAAMSPTRPDLLWVHEDSGNEAVLVALDEEGASVARWTVPDVVNVDWEDMAAIHQPSPTLYVADIGDNRAERDQVVVLRIPEPDPQMGDGLVPAHAEIRLVLPTPADAEALLVDPRTGDIVIVTKEVTGLADVLVAPGAGRSHGATAPLLLERAGSVDLGLFGAVLAGDVSADGDEIVLRTPTDVWWWPRLDGNSLAETLIAREPCRLPSVTDLQGEAIALSPDGGYVLVGEGAGAPIRTAR